MDVQARHDTVAVVIPVYRALYLETALDSVFSQTRPADDVILVDDGSPDQDVLDRVRRRWHGRLRIMSQPNAGAAGARNTGILNTDADLVAFLDADDCWACTYLDLQLQVLASRPECDVVYADAIYTGTTRLAGRRFMELCPSQGEVTATALLGLECQVPLSASVARRRVLRANGLFDPSLRRGHDFDLWLRLALKGVRFAWHALPLMFYRVHADNLSGSSVAQLERALTVFRRALLLPLSDGERATAMRQIERFDEELAIERGKEMLERGDFNGAREALMAVQQRTARWKITAALIGLHVAPELVRRAYVKRAAAAGGD